MHTKLMEEIAQIIKTTKTPERYQTFLTALEQKRYEDALLWGCKYSNPADSKLTELLCTLIRYTKALSLNINSQDQQQNTPIYYAVINKNYNLHFALEKANAKVSEELQHIWNLLLIGTLGQITTKADAEYKKEMTSIQSSVQKLPLKSTQKSDSDNATADRDRLFCMIKIIKHLRTYHHDLKDTSFIHGTLSPIEKEVLYNFRIAQIRTNISYISTIIANLSGSLRKKYVGFLKPLDWITLEQLGGIIKEKEAGIVFTLNLGTVEIGDTTKIKPLMGLTAATKFLDEYSDQEELVECAATSIIADLPALDKFFREVALSQMRNADPTAIPTNMGQVNLPLTRAITRHFNESKFLVELLRLLNYQFGCLAVNTDLSPLEQSLLSHQGHLSHDVLETQLGQHAFLRRLQRLGEIFTRKNTNFIELDQSIDYQAIINLRDFICHQDEGHNKHFIDMLLQEKNQLQQIYTQDLPELMKKIGRFIDLRDARYGGYHGDTAKYWAHVLQIELEHATPSEEREPVAEAPQRRVAEQQEQEFILACAQAGTIEAFKKELSREDAEKLTQDCCNILAGTAEIPTTKERGLLLKPFAVLRKTGNAADKQLNEKIMSIMIQATSRPSTTEEERDEARKKLVTAAKQRLIEKENRLTGLTTIRTLIAKMKQAPERQHLLTPLKRIEAAITATNNIKQFLINAGYVKQGLAHKTMVAWDTYHRKTGKKDLVSLLLEDHVLNDALEYNAGQLLQHLDTLRNYQEAAFCHLLHQDYEAIRSLRNYIEHGHPLIESYDDEFNKHSSCTGQRQKIIAPELIKLVFVLLPDLQKIKTQIEKTEALKSRVSASTDLLGKKVSSIDAPTHLTSSRELPPLVTHSFFGNNHTSTPTPVTPGASSSTSFVL